MTPGSAPIVLAAVLLVAATARGAPIRVPASDLPASVVALGDARGIAALAIADDGSRTAAAFAAADRGRSVVRIAGAETVVPAEVPVRGRVRALRFSRDGAQLYVIAASEPKRGAGETFLLRVDVATLGVSRAFILPRGAADADGLDARTLVVASADELRTFGLPAVTSGPLFRLEGNNRAVAAIPGTRRLLVGRDDRVVLVDLDDAQSREGLPVRRSLDVPAPVAALAVAPDGVEALARLADGRVLRFRADLDGDAVADGEASAIAWPGEREDAPPAEPPPPEPPPPDPPPTEPAPREPSPPKPPPPEEPVPRQPELPPAPEPPPAPDPEPPAPSEPEPPPAPGVPPAPEPEPPVPSEPEPPPPPDPTVERSVGSEGATLSGQVAGAAAGGVVAVVVLGPDNLLREAARVSLAVGGRWLATGLPAGTYRVVLDAGSGRAIEASPSFRTVRLAAGAAVEVAPIEARRVF